MTDLIDTAQREPVAIELTPIEYQRLHGLNLGEFQSFCDRVGQQAKANGLSEKKLAELLGDE